MLKISSRPKSIFIVRINLPNEGIEEKFDIELTSPKPGPTLPMVVIDAENAVNKSTSIAVNAIDRFADLLAELLISIELPCRIDEHLGELGVDPPVPVHVGIGEVV